MWSQTMLGSLCSSPPKLYALKTVWMTDYIQQRISNLQLVRNYRKSLYYIEINVFIVNNGSFDYFQRD